AHQVPLRLGGRRRHGAGAARRGRGAVGAGGADQTAGGRFRLGPGGDLVCRLDRLALVRVGRAAHGRRDGPVWAAPDPDRRVGRRRGQHGARGDDGVALATDGLLGHPGRDRHRVGRDRDRGGGGDPLVRRQAGLGGRHLRRGDLSRPADLRAALDVDRDDVRLAGGGLDPGDRGGGVGPARFRADAGRPGGGRDRTLRRTGAEGRRTGRRDLGSDGARGAGAGLLVAGRQLLRLRRHLERDHRHPLHRPLARPRDRRSDGGRDAGPDGGDELRRHPDLGLADGSPGPAPPAGDLLRLSRRLVGAAAVRDRLRRVGGLRDPLRPRLHRDGAADGRADRRFVRTAARGGGLRLDLLRPPGRGGGGGLPGRGGAGVARRLQRGLLRGRGAGGAGRPAGVPDRPLRGPCGGGAGGGGGV
ncbi:MAG: Uncharacterized MFS-type transporter, partial [uncultured Thermomicrobiales bacterium]